MDSLIDGMDRRSVWRWLMLGCTGVLCITALWMVALSFALPLTPDASIYLLHARTFAATLNRFTLSHDSKGIMLMFLLALPVRLCGATMVAGAVAQTIAYLIVAITIIRLWRRPWRIGVCLAALWLIAAFSPLMWGGRVRPEDFGIAFAACALWGAMAGARRGMFVCGVMMALGFFTKTSLMLAPLAVGVAGAVLAPGYREKGRRLGLVAGGCALVAVVVAGWIVLVDDPGQWVRQTLLWPAEYKRAVGKSGLSWSAVGNLFAMLQAARLQWLFVGGVAGLFYGWRRGPRRWVVLLAALLVAECMRIVIEGEPWQYLLTILLLPLILGTALFGWRRDGRVGMRGVVVAGILLAPVLAATLTDAAQVTRLRLLEHGLTPLEVLAERMAPQYRSGEQIMMNGQNYAVLLHLEAPRPYPVLPLHLHEVSDAEFAATISHFRETPPEWIIDSHPDASPVTYQCIGAPDRLTYVYNMQHEMKDTSSPGTIRLGAAYPADAPVQDLAHQLLRTYPYHLTVDTGLYQAWQMD